LINCVIYCINIFFIGKAFYFFRNTGGLKGNPGDIENILPEWLEDTVAPVVAAAKKVGNKLDENLDKAVAKDKKDDKEAADFNKKEKKEKKPLKDSGRWKWDLLLYYNLIDDY